MSTQGKKFELSHDIDHYLAVLSKLYKQRNEEDKLSIIVNAAIRVHEEWTYDNWNGGTYGHALYLDIPENLYLRFIDSKSEIEKGICSDLNKTHNVQDEFFDTVFIEMNRTEDGDWRSQSEALITESRTVSTKAMKRIWAPQHYRVFLSHKSDVKGKTGNLSNELSKFGISAFVAHEKIKATKEWQEEIENALATMDAFVAILTEKFHESDWTDQEVGYALARGLPLICIKIGRNPYGFIGKFQALKCSWDEATAEVAKILIKIPGMLDAYIHALPKCGSFVEGIQLASVLPEIEEITIEQADAMVEAFNSNPDIRGCWAFNGANPARFGDGLAPILSQLTGKKYVFNNVGVIKRQSK